MLKYLFRKRLKRPHLAVEQIKKIARILVIDDDFPDLPLVDHLKNEKWHVDAMDDLDSFVNNRYVKAHIICLDIMGVGKKLGVENGMLLVKEIKSRNPEKKILLYSSVTEQDIFDEAVDLVDIRLRKTSTYMPFSSAVEELAVKTLNWDDASRYAYEKCKKLMPTTFTFDDFRASIDKSSKDDTIDVGKFITFAKVPVDAGNLVMALLKFVIAVKN